MGIKINQIELLAQGVLTDSTTTCIIYTYFTGCLIDISSIIYSIHSMQIQDKALEINRLIKVENINYHMRAIITRGLYIFYLIFQCGLLSRAVNITDYLSI